MSRHYNFGDYGSAPATSSVPARAPHEPGSMPAATETAEDSASWHDRSQAAKSNRFGGGWRNPSIDD